VAGHYAQAGGKHLRRVRHDGNGTADFVIALTGTINRVASDFLL
jgi:hypothetical protein